MMRRSGAILLPTAFTISAGGFLGEPHHLLRLEFPPAARELMIPSRYCWPVFHFLRLTRAIRIPDW